MRLITFPAQFVILKTEAMHGVFGIVLNHRNVENEVQKVQAFSKESGIPIVGEIPRSNEIIRYEDQGQTVIEGNSESEISGRFYDLAKKLLESEE